MADSESEGVIAISDLESKLYALSIAGQNEMGMPSQVVTSVNDVQQKGNSLDGSLSAFCKPRCLME